MAALFKAPTLSTLFWKCLALNGSRVTVVGAGPNPSGSKQPKNPSLTSILSSRSFMTNPFSSANATPTTPAVDPTKPPKRAPNLFALFVKDHFKELPDDMPVREKFRLTSVAWHGLDEERKEKYRRQQADCMVAYRKAFADFKETLTEDNKDDYIKHKKAVIRDRSRLRIKVQLRKLNYPKKPKSAYLFYLRSQMEKQYPDLKFPSVKSPEHAHNLGLWVQRWGQMSDDEKAPFVADAEKARADYYLALEEWKQNLSKPENHEDLLKLEHLSRKLDNTFRSEDEVARRQGKVRGQVIAKHKKKAKKAALKGAKKAKKSTDDTSTSTKKVTKSKKKTEEVHEEE